MALLTIGGDGVVVDLEVEVVVVDIGGQRGIVDIGGDLLCVHDLRWFVVVDIGGGIVDHWKLSFVCSMI